MNSNILGATAKKIKKIIIFINLKINFKWMLKGSSEANFTQVDMTL